MSFCISELKWFSDYSSKALIILMVALCGILCFTSNTLAVLRLPPQTEEVVEMQPSYDLQVVYGETDGLGVADNGGREADESNQGCTHSLSKTRVVLEASGGKGEIKVTADGACQWNFPLSNIDWLGFSKREGSRGEGIITYKVTRNTTSDSRTAVFIVANEILIISQNGSADTLTTGKGVNHAR